MRVHEVFSTKGVTGEDLVILGEDSKVLPGGKVNT